MLSKIENGNTSPSLTTLQLLADALSVPLTSFFRRFEERRDAVHTKAGEGVELEREGTRAHHQYNLLGHLGANGSGVIVEPYLITLTAESDVLLLAYTRNETRKESCLPCAELSDYSLRISHCRPSWVRC
jgi:hypothetical protein